MRSKKIFGALLSLYGSGQAFSGAYIGAGGDASGAVNTSNGTYDFNNTDQDNGYIMNVSTDRSLALKGGMGKVVLGIDRIVASGKGYFALEASARLGSAKGKFSNQIIDVAPGDDEEDRNVSASMQKDYKNKRFFDLMVKAGGALGNAFPYLQIGPGYGQYEITMDGNSEISPSANRTGEKQSKEFDMAFIGAGVGITYSIAPSVQLDFSSKVFLSQTKTGFEDFLEDSDDSGKALGFSMEQDTRVKFSQWLSGFSLRYNREENMCACPGAPAPQGIFGYGGLNLAPSLTSMDYSAAFDFDVLNENRVTAGTNPKCDYGILNAALGLTAGVESKQDSFYSALEVNASYSPHITQNLYNRKYAGASAILNTTFSSQLSSDILLKLGYQVGNSALYLQGGYGLSKVNVKYDGINFTGKKRGPNDDTRDIVDVTPFLSKQDVWFNNGVVGAGINSQLHKNLSMDIGAKAYIGGKEEAFKNFLDDPDSEDETFRNTVSTFQPIELIGNCSLRYQFSLD